jgi:uncharacterized protein (DUF1499 family)
MRHPATVLCALMLALTAACSGALPEPGGSLGGPRSALPPCAEWPNCVSSDATDPVHAIAPLRLAIPPELAWPALRTAILDLPDTRIAVDTGSYLRAETRGRFPGVIDDLELLLRPGRDVVAVRSASRVGLNDLGANGRRVEALRDALLRGGVIR